LRAVWIHRDMAELARHTVESAHQLAVGHHPRANAFGDRDHHQVAAAFHVVEPDRRKHARVRRILQLDFQTGSLHNRIPDIQIIPAKVRREYQAILAVVEPARQADPDAFDLLAATGLHHTLDGVNHGADRRVWVVWRLHHFLRDELSVGVGESYRG